MNEPGYDFAVFGGDLRQWYVAETLARKGYSVITYAIPILSKEKKSDSALSLEEAISRADRLVGPIPLTKDKQTIYSKNVEDDLELSSFCKLLRYGQILAAGCLSDAICRKCRDKGVSCFDFMKDDSIAIFNSIATAEGAIAEALLRRPENLHGSRCLVLGFGKCGRTLARKLQALSATTTVCARGEAARAVAYTEGFDTINFTKLASAMEQSSYIFNTVPALVCSKDELQSMNKDALLIDIASAPGGVDYRAAKELGKSAYLCLGLPGKYSPKSSADALINALLLYTQKQ